MREGRNGKNHRGPQIDKFIQPFTHTLLLQWVILWFSKARIVDDLIKGTVHAFYAVSKAQSLDCNALAVWKFLWMSKIQPEIIRGPRKMETI